MTSYVIKSERKWCLVRVQFTENNTYVLNTVSIYVYVLSSSYWHTGLIYNIIFTANTIRVGADTMELMNADEMYEFEEAGPVSVHIRKVIIYLNITPLD